MKTIQKTLYYTFLCMALVFTSCSGDDDGDMPEEQGEEQMNGGEENFSAKIDGATFTASTDPATLIGGTKSTANGATTVTAQGSTNNGDFINFSIFDYTGVGTYTTGDNLNNTNLIQYGELMGQSASVWGSNLATSAVGGLMPGEIKITVDGDGVLEGTFSFEGYNAQDMTSKMITEGKFKVNLDN